MLSDVSERRPIARQLAQERLERADKLMYEAKGERASHIYLLRCRIDNGVLVEIGDGEQPTTDPAREWPAQTVS